MHSSELWSRVIKKRTCWSYLAILGLLLDPVRDLLLRATLAAAAAGPQAEALSEGNQHRVPGRQGGRQAGQPGQQHL